VIGGTLVRVDSEDGSVIVFLPASSSSADRDIVSVKVNATFVPKTQDTPFPGFLVEFTEIPQLLQFAFSYSEQDTRLPKT